MHYWGHVALIGAIRNVYKGLGARLHARTRRRGDNIKTSQKKQIMKL